MGLVIVSNCLSVCLTTHIEPLLHHMYTYVLVIEKNRLVCKRHYTIRAILTEYQGGRDPAMKIGMHIIFCVHAVWLQMHPCLKGNVREAWARAFSLLVLQVLSIYLQGLHMLYHIHSHVPCMNIYPLCGL